MNLRSLIVILAVLTQPCTTQAQLTTANGVIRWYEMKQDRQSPYELNSTIKVNAFQQDDSQYSVVLTGEYNSFLRLNTSDGSCVEYKGTSTQDQQPLFKPQDASGKFRGKILFPARLGEKDRRGQSWGNQPVDFDSFYRMMVAMS